MVATIDAVDILAAGAGAEGTFGLTGADSDGAIGELIQSSQGKGFVF